MSNIKRRKKRSTKKLVTILIIFGLGYAAFIAKNKGIISFNKMQLLNKQTNPRSESFSTRSNSTNSNVSSNNKLNNNDSFNGYGVQLLATKELNQAREIMNDFARDGYSAFVLASKIKTETWYKLRLGPYEYEKEAIRIQRQLTRRYSENIYVNDSLVIYRP